MMDDVSMEKISMREVARHRSRDDLWVVIKGKVYDLTAFHRDHPGGAQVILSVAGKDATRKFDPFHPGDIITRFGLKPLGMLDPTTIRPGDVAPDDDNDDEEEEEEQGAPVLARPERTKWIKPTLNQMLNFFDFESVAKHTLSKQAWSYFSSGADDEITLRDNHAVFQRVWLRPRVLVNFRNISMSTKILGHHTSIPIYFTATALGKLAHPDGELAIVLHWQRQSLHVAYPELVHTRRDVA